MGEFAFFAGGSVLNGKRSGIIDIYNSKTGKFMLPPKIFQNDEKKDASELMTMRIGTKAFFFNSMNQLADVYDSTTDKWSTVVFNPPK